MPSSIGTTLSQPLFSSTSSFGCMINCHVPPTTIPIKPSTSTFINSTAQLVHHLSHPLMPCQTTISVHSFDPLCPPCVGPKSTYRLEKDISGTAGACVHGIVEWSLEFRITIQQDRHPKSSMQTSHSGEIITHEQCEVLPGRHWGVGELWSYCGKKLIPIPSLALLMTTVTMKVKMDWNGGNEEGNQ